MVTRALALGVALLLPLVSLAEEKGGVKEVPLKGIKLNAKNGKVEMPTGLSSADDLKMFVEDKEQVEKLAKEIDFANHKALLFAWGGSGRDKLEARQDKSTVVFTYTAGLTRDFRMHRHLFAIPKDAKFEVKTAR
jgi:hypothetical protein